MKLQMTEEAAKRFAYCGREFNPMIYDELRIPFEAKNKYDTANHKLYGILSENAFEIIEDNGTT